MISLSNAYAGEPTILTMICITLYYSAVKAHNADRIVDTVVYTVVLSREGTQLPPVTVAVSPTTVLLGVDEHHGIVHVPEGSCYAQ